MHRRPAADDERGSGAVLNPSTMPLNVPTITRPATTIGAASVVPPSGAAKSRLPLVAS